MTRLLTSLFFILSASSVQALCEGNACEFIQIKEVDDCIVLVNTHVQNEVRVSVAAEEMGYTWKIGYFGPNTRKGAVAILGSDHQSPLS